MAVQRLNFFQQVDLNRWIPKTDSNKYNSNSSKGCFLEVDLKYPKELHELHNDYYPLAPDKIEIKKYLQSHNQWKNANFYNIPIGNVKILDPVFDKEKYVRLYENLHFYSKLGLKLRKCIMY